MPRLITSLLIAVALHIFWTSAVLGQQISGQVRYFDTGQAALNVLVRCNGTGGRFDILTDRSGNFRFFVSPGNYLVSIHQPGYIAEERSVDLVDKNSNEYFLFRLKPDGSGAKPPNSPGPIDPNVPATARKEFDQGEAALASEKKESIEEGIHHLEKAVSIYPKFVQAQLRIGTAYMDLAQWDKAEQGLRKTLEIDPKAANAFFALGEIYLRQKKSDEAEKVLLQGLAVEPNSFQGHLTLGRAYWEMASKTKDATQARPSLENSYDQVNEALKLNPNLAEAHLLKGNLLLRVRRAPDALNEFEEYLRLEPKGKFAEPTRGLVDKIKKALEQQKKP